MQYKIRVPHISILLLLLLMGTSVYGQKKVASQGKSASKSTQEDQMAKSLVDYYKNVAKLTAAQQPKVQAICSEFANAVFKLNIADRKERQAAVNSLIEKRETKIYALLTKEQQTLLNEFNAKSKKSHQ